MLNLIQQVFMDPLMYSRHCKEYKRDNENCPGPQANFKLLGMAHSPLNKQLTAKTTDAKIGYYRISDQREKKNDLNNQEIFMEKDGIFCCHGYK